MVWAFPNRWQDQTTPITHIDAYRRLGPVDTDRKKYSMLDRAPEATRLPHLPRNAVGFLAYSPLSLGLLTGKMDADRQFPPCDMRASHPPFTSEDRAQLNQMLSRMEPRTQAHQANIAQLVLAWTMAQPGVTHVLTGARNAVQARGNAAAGQLQLTADQPARIAALLGN